MKNLMKKNPPITLFLILISTILTHYESRAQDAFDRVESKPELRGGADTGLFSATDLAEIEAAKALQGDFPPATNAGSANRPPLIISTHVLDNITIADIEEDMKIMASLLNDTTGTSNRAAWASGIPLINYSKSQRNRDIYISGTGALFFLQVDFPLIGRSDKERIVEDTPKDSAWERARRKVQGQSPRANMASQRMYHAFNNGHPVRPKPFNAEQVSVFRAKLVEALASASNIRALKPSEQVWLVVEGPTEFDRAPSSSHSEYEVPGSPTAYARAYDSTARRYFFQTIPSQLNQTEGKTSRLTISATKRDIDDLHDGTISMKDFLSRMNQHTH